MTHETHTHTHTYIRIYIYIHIYVCVCVCAVTMSYYNYIYDLVFTTKFLKSNIYYIQPQGQLPQRKLLDVPSYNSFNIWLQITLWQNKTKNAWRNNSWAFILSYLIRLKTVQVTEKHVLTKSGRLASFCDICSKIFFLREVLKIKMILKRQEKYIL